MDEQTMEELAKIEALANEAGSREIYELIYGAPGEYPAMEGE